MSVATYVKCKFTNLFRIILFNNINYEANDKNIRHLSIKETSDILCVLRKKLNIFSKKQKYSTAKF